MAKSDREQRFGFRRLMCGVIVAGTVVLAGVIPARSARDTETCLAKKLQAWGNLRKCETAENAKTLRGNAADLGKCRARLEAKLAQLDDQATAAGIDCRYGLNGDGTVTDYDTGLQWEQKTDDGSVHDMDNRYCWSTALPGNERPDGSLFTEFLAQLNDCRTSDPKDVESPGFAGHCDWRVPSVTELADILDPDAPGCSTLTTQCLNQVVFGPAHANLDPWLTSTTWALMSDHMWTVAYWHPSGLANPHFKRIDCSTVRAVRTAF